MLIYTTGGFIEVPDEEPVNLVIREIDFAPQNIGDEPEPEPEPINMVIREIDEIDEIEPEWELDELHRLIKGRKATRKVVVPARLSAGGRDLYSSWFFDDDGGEYVEPKWEEPPDYVPTGNTPSCSEDEDDEDEDEDEDEEVEEVAQRPQKYSMGCLPSFDDEERERDIIPEPPSTSIPVGSGSGTSYTTKHTPIFSRFYVDRLSSSKGEKITKIDIYHIFNKWKKDNNIDDPPLGELWMFLEEKHKLIRGTYLDVKIKWKEGERKQMKIEKMKLVNGSVNVDKLIEEKSWIDEYETNTHRLPPPRQSYRNEPLMDVLDYGRDGIVIHRHPVYTEYGGDLKTGKIYKLNKNVVGNILKVQLDKGGVVLSLGKMGDKRFQKHYKISQFIADCGKLHKPSELHELKINLKHPDFINFGAPCQYPLSCLSYEYTNQIVKEIAVSTEKNKVAKAGKLLSVCRTNKMLENYLDTIKSQFIAELKKKDDENAKLKSRNTQLEEQNKQLNTPLSAGALQLQHLLMTRVDETNTTFKDMLQFCFKDITRNYPTEDDEDTFLSDTDENDRNDAHFGVFEMSPRGLPYDNEHITREVD